jgi:hypothetical protein
MVEGNWLGLSPELFIEMLKIFDDRVWKLLFLILDSLPAHRAKIVSDYATSTNAKLQVSFCPATH